jgi:hypothetical protein
MVVLLSLRRLSARGFRKIIVVYKTTIRPGMREASEKFEKTLLKRHVTF